MSPIETMLTQSMRMSARLGGEAVWLMEERALAHYLTRPRAEFGDRRVINPLSLVTPRGEVAVIEVRGVLMKDPIFDDETSTPAIEEAIRTVGDDPQFSMVVYDIDSPGGSSAGIASLEDAARTAAEKKTVIAQSRGMVASGAYWLAATASQIFAERMDWIGSIGVRIDVFDASRWFANLGVERVVIDTGPLKSTGVFGTEVTEEQRQYLRTLVEDTDRHFTEVVTRGRKLSAAEFAAVHTGGVFPAVDALRLKLIDGIQSLDKTLAAMPRRQTFGGRTMSQNSDSAVANRPATLKELKTAMPGADAEFLMAQVEREATLNEALAAYGNFLKAENEKLRQRIQDEEEEKKKAEEEKKKEEAEEEKKKEEEARARGAGRGNKPAKTTAVEAEAGDADFRQMAEQYMREKKCRWSEACLEIKRRYPEARAYFGAPPK